jgi:prepilin-type N-terminal cleavage/methylation domain-containing protein
MTRGRGMNAGFTLAELLVATTLITIVMGAVYSSMTNSLRAWRIAESDMAVYQTARTAMDIMTRELQCVIPGAAHLMEGENNELTFFAVTPPLEVEDGEGPRALQVRYRIGGRGQGDKRALVREESVVESALPLVPPGEDPVDKGRLKLGREREFDLATGVEDFQIEYYWQPPTEEWPQRKPDEPPEPMEMIVEHEHREKWGLPQGIRLTLSLRDPNHEGEVLEFTSFVAFRGPSSYYNRQAFGRTGDE